MKKFKLKNRIDEDYNFKKIEKKWENIFWNFYNSLNIIDKGDKKKKYVLAMFPYPSASGLHMGHFKIYTIADIIARFHRIEGFNVFFPMGWDAFGLPSEQYAVKNNTHPHKFNQENISNFKKEFKKMGLSFNWKNEINTSDHKYYHWTQWIFREIYNSDLAKYEESKVLWCDKLSTVLSKEETKNLGNEIISERGNYPVTEKIIPQWILKITNYCDKLLKGLEELKWPERIKNIQKEWIGESKGSNIKFKILEEEDQIEIFTTSEEMIYGVNCIAIANTGKQTEKILSMVKSKSLEKFLFLKQFQKKNIFKDLKNDSKDGEFTGIYCINPINEEIIPIWIVNFVSENYGTGASMICSLPKKIFEINPPRDFISEKKLKNNKDIDHNFSLKYDIINRNYPNKYKAEIDRNFYINSPLIEKCKNREEAAKIIKKKLNELKVIKEKTNYHLKDWVFSRQRFWGEPIPIIHDTNDNSTYVLEEKDLPLKLPNLKDYRTSPSYYSPLQKAAEWVKISDNLRRDINVMPQWAGSSWYYIAFLLKNSIDSDYLKLNESETFDILSKWLPVDIYIGGPEHATTHLIYSRFWNIFLNEKGIIANKEPFKELVISGMILGPDGEKMSKSKGNVITVKECINNWGSDSLKIYLMSLGPIDKDFRIDNIKIFSYSKWLKRVYTFFSSEKYELTENFPLEEINKYSEFLKEIKNYYKTYKFNLVIAKLRDFINNCYLKKGINIIEAKDFLILMNPIVPYLSEEIWSWMEKDPIYLNKYINPFNKIITNKNENKKQRKILVQLNGKIIFTKNDESVAQTKEKLIEEIKKEEKINYLISKKEIKKTLFIENHDKNVKIINFIIEN